jgi:hypothetical protein
VLAQPLHHAGPLTQNADASVGIEQVGHGDLQDFHWRQLTLFRTLKRRISDVNGIEKTFGPRFWPRRFQHNRLAFLPDKNVFRQMNALGQTNRLPVAFEDDGCSFHAFECMPQPDENKPGNAVYAFA